jgi:two-component system, NtrC family, sensor kinase
MDLEQRLQELERTNRILKKQLHRSEMNRIELEKTHDLKESLLRKVIQDVQESERTIEEKNQILQQQAQALEATLSELKQAQFHLVQSEKMSSLGQLVAGVAHEINNPVNFIYGNLNYAIDYANHLMQALQCYQQHYPQVKPQLADVIEELNLDFVMVDFPKLLTSMQMGAERIQEIVRSLRTFSRLDEAEIKAVNLHEGIDSTLLILEHQVKARANYAAIQVIKEYGDLPEVECYAGKLNQVFMNLLSNAIDALEPHRISAALGPQSQSGEAPGPSVDRPPPTIYIRTEATEQQIRIGIIDNGPGISPALQTRIFDPFFTTKQVGQGTGLGLSISYQIVTERHGGNLRCLSSPQGTEFWLELPFKKSQIVQSMRQKNRGPLPSVPPIST